MLSSSHHKITDLAIPGASPRPTGPGSTPQNCETRACLWVPETLFTSRDLLIFVEEAAEAVVSFDLGDVGRCAVGERPCGGCLPQTAVRTMIIVVLELAQHRQRRVAG